jgi:hypothetical protein
MEKGIFTAEARRKTEDWMEEILVARASGVFTAETQRTQRGRGIRRRGAEGGSMVL